jgi:YHS domain-containing protein
LDPSHEHKCAVSQDRFGKNDYKWVSDIFPVIKMAIDPVCGMEVEEKKAKYVSEYGGKKYYFCAAGCKKEFDKNPKKYTD